jgi:hypothetical protein
VTAATAVDHAQLESFGTQTDFSTKDFTIAAPHAFTNQDDERTIVYTAPNGQTVQVVYLAQGGQTAQGTTKCMVAGFAAAQ